MKKKGSKNFDPSIFPPDIGFEDAVLYLPSTADPAEEEDWVLGHPALGRKTRQGNDGPVAIEVADVYHERHGNAPSRRAVNDLIHWVNSPAKLHERLLLRRQREELSKGQEEAVDLGGDVPYLKRMLDQIDSTVKAKKK